VSDPTIDRADFHFVQDGNTLGSTEEVEVLEISLQTQLPGEMPFFVLRTNGWSINDAGELAVLITKCEKFFKENVK